MARRLEWTTYFRGYDHDSILRQLYRWEKGQTFPEHAQLGFAKAFENAEAASLPAKEEALIVRDAYRRALMAVGLPKALRAEIERYVALDVVWNESGTDPQD